MILLFCMIEMTTRIVACHTSTGVALRHRCRLIISQVLTNAIDNSTPSNSTVSFHKSLNDQENGANINRNDIAKSIAHYKNIYV